MPRSDNDPQRQYATVEDLLTRWLPERRRLLGSYTELVVALQDQPSDTELRRRQQSLCELLVDYVSAGHFEIYHHLLSEAECFADGSGEMALQLMPALGDTTEVILAYEEKYTARAQGPQTKLKRDLTALGEVLESRFELEDRLIAGLHARHRQPGQQEKKVRG